MEIIVVRAFLLGGARQEPGSRISVDNYLARELIALGKATPAAETPPEAGPLTTTSAQAVVSATTSGGRTRKES